MRSNMPCEAMRMRIYGRTVASFDFMILLRRRLSHSFRELLVRTTCDYIYVLQPLCSIMESAESLQAVNVTHHSIELTWRSPSGASRVLYTVQEEEVGKGKGFSNIYSGYSTHCVSTGLSSLTTYQYRIRTSIDSEHSVWSQPITITTTRQPKTSENLHKAIKRGDIELTQSILETSPHYVDVPDIYGLSPLMNACRLGNTSIAELLLSLGATTEYCNKAGKTSLMEATYNGHLECVKLLVSHGASWNKYDQSGMSALHWAVDGGHEGVVCYALNDGVKVNEISDNTIAQYTPLLKAASVSGNARVAHILIEYGADVNATSSTGQTPLILAAVGGHSELTSVLLDAGADPTVVNTHGQTTLDIARAMEKTDVVQVLEEHQLQQ